MTTMQVQLLPANRVLPDCFNQLPEQPTAFRAQLEDINTCKALASAPRALQACSYSVLAAPRSICVKTVHTAGTLSSLEPAISQTV